MHTNLFRSTWLAWSSLLVLTAGNVSAQSLSFSKIADTSTTAPGHGVFTSLGIPSMSGSVVSFGGNYSGGAGIYTGTIGVTAATKVVDFGNTAPGQSAYVGFGAPVVSGNNLSFLGFYGGSRGIYTGTVGATGSAKIVDFTNTAPGHGAFTAFFNGSISGNTVVFPGSYSGGSGIYTGTVGATGSTKVVDTGDIAPGQGFFQSFGGPAISGNTLAFSGFYSAGNGIYTGTVGATGSTKVVDISNIAPGHGAFTGFSNPSITSSRLTYQAAYGDGTGIYTSLVGSTGATKIVDTSDIAPGHGAFTDFGFTPATNGSIVAFIGNFSGGNGLYLQSGSGFIPLLSTGDSLFGGTVSNLALSSTGFDNNNIVFQYSLADGRIGVGVVAVPEPATVALITMTLSGIGYALWRKRARIVSQLDQELPLLQ